MARVSKFVIKGTGKGKDKTYSWRLVSPNGKITASGTGLNKKPDVKYLVKLVTQLQTCKIEEQAE